MATKRHAHGCYSVSRRLGRVHGRRVRGVREWLTKTSCIFTCVVVATRHDASSARREVLVEHDRCLGYTERGRISVFSSRVLTIGCDDVLRTHTEPWTHAVAAGVGAAAFMYNADMEDSLRGDVEALRAARKAQNADFMSDVRAKRST
jgi:hypothetical protein